MGRNKRYNSLGYCYCCPLKKVGATCSRNCDYVQKRIEEGKLPIGEKNLILLVVTPAHTSKKENNHED